MESDEYNIKIKYNSTSLLKFPISCRASTFRIMSYFKSTAL